MLLSGVGQEMKKNGIRKRMRKGSQGKRIQVDQASRTTRESPIGCLSLPATDRPEEARDTQTVPLSTMSSRCKGFVLPSSQNTEPERVLKYGGLSHKS